MNTEKIDTGLLVEEHSDYLLSFAMSKLRDIDLSKDLVQDTFLSAITKIDTFENRSNIRTWLTSILNRKIIDHWRRAETRYTDPISSFFDQDDPNKSWILDQKDNASLETIEDEIIHDETNTDLLECVEKLPEKWKGVIASKYLDEKVSEEICKDLDITPSNLWVIIHRAKLLMRDCLKKRDVR
jgi:RNA polymerase sigma factor (sigma-70 family)